MTKEFPKLYKVTLRLFTYHLQTGSLTNYDQINLSDAEIAAYYEVLLRDYHAINSNAEGVPIPIQWRSNDLQTSTFDLLNTEAKNGRRIQKFTLKHKPPFECFFYPQFFYDSYIGFLTIYLPDSSGKDGLTLEELKNLKPSNNFFTGITATTNDNLDNDNLDNDNLDKKLKTAFLGKTAILSAQLTKEPGNLTQFAQSVLLNFLGLSNPQEAPILRNCRQLFYGYLYEFYTPEQGDNYGKIWLFLTFHPSSIKRLNQAQFDLAELFLYDRKSFGNYEDSKIEYKQGLENIQEVGNIIRKFPSKISDDKLPDLSSEQLNQLKRNLRTLLDISLSYSQNLRSLGDFQNTIDLHWENYQQKITYIEDITDSNLTSTLKLADRDFGRFQKQIAANLIYLREGSRLLDTAIATIRGLVEIEQTEGDRTLQEQNQKLQDYIQALGFGIGAGAILASTSGLITQPWVLPNCDNITDIRLIHPFLVAFFGSLALAIFAFYTVICFLKWKRKKK